MKIGKLSCSFVVLFASLVLALPARAANPTDVPLFQAHDFSFTSKTQRPNPFVVDFSATVRGPDGKTFVLPGFFDGSGTWRLRVAPTATGQWSLVTKSDVKELDGQIVSFTGVKNPNPRGRGILRVDQEHPHHFVFGDGTRFFLQGYEYDWLWALDMDQPGVPTVEQSLDILVRYGFNYTILNSYAHDTGWRRGKSGSDDYGPPLLYAWEGTNDQPDHSRMNLEYWRHYDRVMTALAERGMQAHLFVKVYNKQVNWPERGSVEERMFFRWLVARYAAFPNVIWDFSKEAHNEKDLAYKQQSLKFIRELDPYHHLVTVHDDDKVNDAGAYDELTDFRADQQHGNWREVIRRQRARRAWPVVNVEFGYEHGLGGPNDKTYGVVQPPEEVLRRAWEIAMAGGYTVYYYTYTAWDVVRPIEIPTGYAYFKHFGEFWRGVEFWKLEPSNQRVNQGWCLAQPGRQYIVFQNKPKPFTLDLGNVKSPLVAEWFNPLNGQRTNAGSLERGAANFMPPRDWGNAPLVLHVRTAE